MGTLSAKALRAASLLRRDLYSLQETLAAPGPDVFYCWAATHVAVAATGNCLCAAVNTAASSSITKGLQPQSVFLVAPRSALLRCISDSPLLLPLDALLTAVAAAAAAIPVASAAYPVASVTSIVPAAAALTATAVVRIVAANAAAFASGAAAISDDNFIGLRTGLRTGLDTEVHTSLAPVAPSPASIPSAVAGGLALAAVEAVSLMTASAAALVSLDATATASVTDGVSCVASDTSEEVAAISAATGSAVMQFKVVSVPMCSSASSSNEPVSAGAANPAAYGVLTALPYAASARLAAEERFASAEYAVVAVRGVDGCSLRQQQQQDGAAETTRVKLQKQRHLGVNCVLLSFLCTPPSWEARLLSSVFSSQQDAAYHKDHDHSFPDCCCGSVSAGAVTPSSALQDAESLPEANRVCPAPWHSFAFCFPRDIREKKQGRRAGAAVTLLTVLLLTLALQAALTSNAAFALRVEAAALTGTSIAVYAEKQRHLSRVVIARSPGVNPFVSVAVAAIPAAASGGGRLAARPGACAAWRSVVLCVPVFASSATDFLAVPAAAASFTANSRWRAVLAGVPPPRSQCRRNSPAATAAALLRRLDTSSAAVAARAASTDAIVLTPVTSSRRSATAAVARSERWMGTDAFSSEHSAAALLHAYTQQKGSCSAAVLGESSTGGPAASALAAPSPTASSPAVSSPASSARAAFAASASAAGAPSVFSCTRAAATASPCSRSRIFALIRSLRLQAPLLELQLPQLVLRLPLQAISIHLRYKLHSPRSRSSNRSSNSSNTSTYATSRSSSIHTSRRPNDNSNNARRNSGRERSRPNRSNFSVTSTESLQENSNGSLGKDSRSVSTHPHSSSEKEDSSRNNAERYYSLNMKSCSKTTKRIDLEEEEEPSLEIVASSSEAKSTVDSSSRSSSVYGDDNREVRSSIAEEQEQREGQRQSFQPKEEDEATAVVKRETAEGKAAGAVAGRRKEYMKQTAGERLAQPAAGAAMHVQRDDTGIKATLQQAALQDQQDLQQQLDELILGVHQEQQQQQKATTFLPQGFDRQKTASRRDVHSSSFDSSSPAAAADRVAAPLLKAAAASAAADLAAAASAQAAGAAAASSTRETAPGEAQTAKAESAAAAPVSRMRGVAEAKGGPAAGATTTPAGMAYEPTAAAAVKAGERTLEAIAAIGDMLRACISPSIGVDIHPASNTLCFVAEAFPLKTAVASSFTKALYHFLFPPSAAALLRLSLFPDGFCMISSALISPAAIVSHLLSLFSSSGREEEREKPKKRLLVHAGLQHRWVGKLMQLLQVQFVAGCNLLHAVLAPRSAFFTLLLLGRPPCCPRGMRRCYRKALFRQQRRLWRQQQQLWVKQQQEQQWQQQELHEVWAMQKHEQSGNAKDHVSPEALKRWYSSSKSRSESSSNSLFRRDLAFLMLRSGAAGDTEEEENRPAASASETFVAKLAFVVAAGSSSTDTGDSSIARAADVRLDAEEDEEDEQGKQTQGKQTQGKQTQTAFLLDFPISNCDNTTKQNACIEQALSVAAEGCSLSSSVQQRALRWLRLLLRPQGVPTAARRGKSSSSGSVVTDAVLLDYREAAAVREATPTLRFSSRLLNKFLGEAQLFCSAVARGRVQWSGSDAGAAVDLQQVLATVRRARNRRKQLRCMQQTPHAAANQTQVVPGQREGEQHVQQQQQTQKQQHANQEHEGQVQRWRVVPSERGERAAQGTRSCAAAAAESVASVGQPVPLQQQTTLQQQQLLQEQEQQQQVAEGEVPSPWSVLLRAGDVSLDVDHLTLRLELVPAADAATAAGTSAPTLPYLA